MTGRVDRGRGEGGRRRRDRRLRRDAQDGRDGGGDVPEAAGPGPGGGQHRGPAARDREDGRGARAGAGEAGLDHAAPEVQGRRSTR